MKLIDILNEGEELPFGNKPSEARKVLELAAKINSAIVSIDDSMSYGDFAKAVAIVLRDEYGRHTYKLFTDELNTNLE